MPLEYAISAASKQYLLGRVEGLPDNKLSLLLRFLDDVERLQKEIAPPPEAPPPPPAPVLDPLAQPAGLDPLAVPQAAPVSEMLPITA